jgi:hypothetical protein
MKLALILSDYSVNQLKYISAGGILLELFNRDIDCEIFIVMKKSVKKKTFSISGEKTFKRNY